MKIIGFFHVCFMGVKAKEIVDEILTELQNDGLLDILDELHIGIIGGKIIVNNPKIKTYNLGSDFKQFEFPTLRILQKKCKENPDAIIFYLHTKGTSSPFDEGKVRWRRDMLYCIVNRHQECIKGLENYDTVGTRFYTKKDFPPHYSGNFWWAKASYINTLPDIDNFRRTDIRIPSIWKGEHKDRLYAEMWILSNPNVLALNIV